MQSNAGFVYFCTFFERMKTAVVILNWNGRNLLESFLPSVTAHTGGDTAIYVADNASTDQSVDYVRNNYPDVRLILLDKNYGFAEGYNRALAQIDAEYYCLLNSDVEVTPNWTEPVTAYLDTHPDTAVCSPNWKRTVLSMLGRPEAFLTASGTLSAAEESSPHWRRTKGNMTGPATFSGPQAPACLSVPMCTTGWADWTPTSSHTWRRLISAGGYATRATKWPAVRNP